ncbi:MAG: hypothetical protein E7Z96_02370 [Actinomycetaceae bacterium]|nr:hypothetical protein [Actinomycetaceae bacterium]
MLRKDDLISGGLAFLVGGAFLVSAVRDSNLTFEAATSDGVPGAGFFPIVLGALLAALGLALAVRALVPSSSTTKKGQAATPGGETPSVEQVLVAPAAEVEAAAEQEMPAAQAAASEQVQVAVDEQVQVAVDEQAQAVLEPELVAVEQAASEPELAPAERKQNAQLLLGTLALLAVFLTFWHATGWFYPGLYVMTLLMSALYRRPLRFLLIFPACFTLFIYLAFTLGFSIQFAV